MSANPESADESATNELHRVISQLNYWRTMANHHEHTIEQLARERDLFKFQAETNKATIEAMREANERYVIVGGVKS